MSKNGDLIEASLFCAGVNTYPSIMASGERMTFLSNAVNRSSYRKINDTRPPFREVHLSFQSTEDEHIFRNAALTGMKYYDGEFPYFSSFLIIAVGDRVLAGYIRGNSLDFIQIYKGLDPQWHFQFFCKGLNILTINNGKTPGLYWTGDPVKPVKYIYQSEYIKDDAPMPVSNLCVYAFGRFFPVTEQNLVFAGDWIYSQGYAIEQREAILSFSESKQFTSGDGWGAPADMGVVTGIVAMPQSNTLTGYGDVNVLCRNGVFSIAPNRKPRNEWTTDPEMQKHVFIGKGCAAPMSITTFNNQVFYRDCNTGISSLNLDIATYQRGSDFLNISRAVDRYTGYDANSENITYTSAVSSDHRLLMSTCHRKEISIEAGVHRYGMGIVSACIQQDAAGNGSNSMVWEGLWTGLRPTAMESVNIGNTRRAYIASYDADKQNRIYIFEERMRGDDLRVPGTGETKGKRIKSKFSFSSLFSDIGQPTPSLRKQLRRVDLLLLKAQRPEVSFSYSSDARPIWEGVDIQLTETSNIVGYKDGFATYNGLSNDIQLASASNRHSGYFFDAHFDLVGPAEVGKIVFSSSVQNPNGFEEVATTCTVRPAFEFNCQTFGNYPYFQTQVRNFEYNIYDPVTV